MIFVEAPIAGVWLIRPERLPDDRGHFARVFSAAEFAQRGMDPTIAQCSTSFNHHAGTLRGMHYQAAPHAESKLVRCTRGAIHDVALDLRRDSPSYLQSYAVQLSDDNGDALFLPTGCAHGFQTLRDDSEIYYQISVPYEAASARGVRWDDPAFAIAWPQPPARGRTLSERDATYPDHGT